MKPRNVYQSNKKTSFIGRYFKESNLEKARTVAAVQMVPEEMLEIGVMMLIINLIMVIEKFCYDKYDSNCEAFGGLYQWDEAMQYA
jgi:hypothetical protein